MGKLLTGRNIACLIGLVCVIGGIVWWYGWFESGDYRPKAYVGIARWDVDEPVRLNHRSHILEIDLATATVSDSFPVSDVVSRVHVLEVDSDSGLLYVGGEDPGMPGGDTGYHNKGVDVYDLDTKKKLRTIKITGPRKFTHMRLSRNGKRLLASNPFSNEAPGEKGAHSGVYDVKTGNFIYGFDQIASEGDYISNRGERIYNIFGLQKSASLWVYSTKKDEKLLHILQDPERILRRGGLHPDVKRGFKLKYPYYVWTHHWKPMEIYDRKTMKQIDTGPIVMKNLNKNKVHDEHSSDATMMSKNNRYQVVKFLKGHGRTKKDPVKLFVRIIDLKELKIIGTVKIWEGVQGDYSNVVAY